MADRIGMALRLAKEGRTEGFQYLYEYTVEKQLGKAIALMGDIGQAQSLQILQEHETSIKAYNQYRQTLGVDDFVSDNENMSIALSDVTGDGVPELLFVEKSSSSEEYVEYDALNIFTVENDAAKQIYYADHWLLEKLYIRCFRWTANRRFTRAMACRMKAPLRITADMLYSLMEPYRRSH